MCSLKAVLQHHGSLSVGGGSFQCRYKIRLSLLLFFKQQLHTLIFAFQPYFPEGANAARWKNSHPALRGSSALCSHSTVHEHLFLLPRGTGLRADRICWGWDHHRRWVWQPLHESQLVNPGNHLESQTHTLVGELT